MRDHGTLGSPGRELLSIVEALTASPPTMSVEAARYNLDRVKAGWPFKVHYGPPSEREVTDQQMQDLRAAVKADLLASSTAEKPGVWPDQSAQHAVLLEQIKDAYAEGKADAVALIREKAANALPEVARFTLDEIEAIVGLSAVRKGEGR